MPTASRRSRSTTSRSTARRSREPEPLRMLKEDHEKVESLFEEFDKSESTREKHELAMRICEELRTHARLEETIVYPAIREALDDEEMMDEALVEHETAKDLMAKIERTEPSEDRFGALVKVLGEYVRHHVKEEEGEMFKQARKAELDFDALGERMREMRGESGGEEHGD